MTKLLSRTRTNVYRTPVSYHFGPASYDQHNTSRHRYKDHVIFLVIQFEEKASGVWWSQPSLADPRPRDGPASIESFTVDVEQTDRWVDLWSNRMMSNRRSRWTRILASERVQSTRFPADEEPHTMSLQSPRCPDSQRRRGTWRRSRAYASDQGKSTSSRRLVNTFFKQDINSISFTVVLGTKDKRLEWSDRFFSRPPRFL